MLRANADFVAEELEDERDADLAAAARDISDGAERLDGYVRLHGNVESRLLVGRQGCTRPERYAAPCDAEQLSAIIDRLERLLGCHLKLTTEIDSSLIGGFAALVDGKVYDFSYVTQLSAMQQKLA